MIFLFWAYFAALERNVFQNVVYGFTCQMFVQIDIAPDPLSLFSAIGCYLMNECFFFISFKEYQRVVFYVIISFKVNFQVFLSFTGESSHIKYLKYWIWIFFYYNVVKRDFSWLKIFTLIIKIKRDCKELFIKGMLLTLIYPPGFDVDIFTLLLRPILKSPFILILLSFRKNNKFYHLFLFFACRIFKIK